MTNFKEEGFKIDALDLANVSPGPDDDHRVYNHDGTSTLTLTDGSTTSNQGWYMWSNPDSAWFPMGQHADLVDGYHGAELAALAENETVSGTWTFNSGTTYKNGISLDDGTIIHGVNPGDTITETTSPKSFDFSGGTNRDIFDYSDVTISNGSTSSATETVTVELYDGTDTTGTLLDSESISVTVAAGGSKTVTFLNTEIHLDTGTYHVNITTSGTTLAVDQTDVYTKGAVYKLGQTADGNLFLDDQDGTRMLEANPTTENIDVVDLSVNGTNVHEGDHNSVSIPFTEWASGLTDEEIHRINVPTGKKLYVYSLEVGLKGGATIATPSNLQVEVYDSTGATSLASDSADGSSTTGTPIGSSSDGATVLVRLTNSTGNSQIANIQANLVIK